MLHLTVEFATFAKNTETMNTKKNASFFDLININRARLRTITVYKRLNQWIVRVSTNVKKPGTGVHPNVERTNQDFKAMRKFAASFSRAMEGYPAWKFAAKLYGVGKTGDNFMCHMNHDKMMKGGVACFHLFRFSFGPRSLPWVMEATAAGNTVTLTWQDNRHTPTCSPGDLLLVGVILESRPKRPMLLADTGATRDSAGITFEIPASPGEVVHLYPFFCNPERTEFSESLHLTVNIA